MFGATEASFSQQANIAVNDPNPIVVRKMDGVGYAWANIPSGYRLSIRVPEPLSTERLSASILCKGFAMTGGYTQRGKAVPDGLIVLSGKIVGTDNGRQDGGILGIQGTSVSLRRAKDARQAPNTTVDQIYSQPILIYNGVVDGKFKEGKSNRVALGSYEDGSLFMVMAFDGDRNGVSAVSLARFADDVKTTADKKVDWLLNFDGGPSAFLYAYGHRPIAPTAGMATSYLCAEPNHD